MQWLGKGGGWATGAVIRTDRFDLAGVDRHGVQLRVRSGGRWSRWATPADGGPVVAVGSHAVQVRARHRVRGLRVKLMRAPAVKPATPAATRPKTLPLPTTNAPAPTIIPRSDWDPNDRCHPRTSPAFGNIQLAFVHHTASLNGYSRSQSAAIVLGICLFHRDGNGWNDMGYNFLVDRYGQVFEGRGGGIDQPVIGAQAGGFNTPSTGVSVIGDFTSAAPSKAAMSSLARLLAWKLSIHAVPAVGKTTVTSAGGPSTGYPAGRGVTLNRISGHRDADLTACPGAVLYRRLPALRRKVAKLEGATSALTFDTSTLAVQYGFGPYASGTLTLPGGQPGAGEPVEIRALAVGRERVIATAITASNGTWSASLPALKRSSVLRAVFTGTGADRPGVISPLRGVTVYPIVAIGADQRTVPAGSSVLVTGGVRPGKRRVILSVTGEAGKAQARRLAAADGSFQTRVKLARPGTYRIVASVPADSATAAGRSAPLEVQATP